MLTCFGPRLYTLDSVTQLAEVRGESERQGVALKAEGLKLAPLRAEAEERRRSNKQAFAATPTLLQPLSHHPPLTLTLHALTPLTLTLHDYPLHAPNRRAHTLYSPHLNPKQMREQLGKSERERQRQRDEFAQDLRYIGLYVVGLWRKEI